MWKPVQGEIQRGRKILNLGSEDTALKPLVDEGVYLLLSLLARVLDDNSYTEYDFDPDYFDPREIHLLSLK